MGTSTSSVAKCDSNSDKVSSNEENASSSKRLKVEDVIRDEEHIDLHVVNEKQKEAKAKVPTKPDVLTNIIVENLTCHQCGHLPRHKPILICQGGKHVLCISCYQISDILMKCNFPGCKLEFTQDHNMDLVNKLLVEVVRKCSWSDNGCCYQASLKDLVQHEHCCKYQSIQCWVCKTSSPLTQFHHHNPSLGCFHNQKIYSSPVRISMSIKNCLPVAVTFHEDIFILHLSRISSRSVWVVCVMAQLTPDDCELFKVSVDISKLHSDHKFSFNGPVGCVTDTMENILKKGNCLVLTDPAINNLTSEDDVIEIAIELKKYDAS